MKCREFAVMALAALMLALPGDVAAREGAFEGDSPEPEEIVEKTMDGEQPRADDWFTNPSQGEDYGTSEPNNEGEESEEKKEKPRFIEILRDDSFIYWMDTKTAYYTNLPHSIKERMIDVWIKLEPTEYLEGEYTFPAKYYLEHYLIRPKTQQIQFVCELEVAGRPNNDVKKNAYDPRRWENLIPGSIEDAVYHAVLKHKSYIRDEASSNGTSIRDYIEDTLNVSF